MKVEVSPEGKVLMRAAGQSATDRFYAKKCDEGHAAHCEPLVSELNREAFCDYLVGPPGTFM